MEGLIPVVYKSLKKKRTRGKYECLSSGAAPAYNIHQDDDHTADGRGDHLRRCNSVPTGDDAKPNQLVRFRSHRVLSCLTG
ncbi:hypothetical protein ACS0TY_023312 [Phlomoides rotata]